MKKTRGEDIFTEAQDKTILKMKWAGYENDLIGERLGKSRISIERRYRALLKKMDATCTGS